MSGEDLGFRFSFSRGTSVLDLCEDTIRRVEGEG